MVNKGDEVKDRVSGFTGIVIAQHSYLNGCDRMSVQPKVDKDGKLPDSCTFDEPDLIVVNASVVKQGSKRTGGPEKYMPSEKPE